MNIAVRLTLDGMVRALRWKLHTLSEEAITEAPEAGRRSERREAARREEGADERAGE
ncbi:MAG: hypothetical protein J0H34_07835 [Rhizobiales bacterium]|nr:hypothetical protein [Hyphomicrobiales bacterium]